MNYAQPVVSQKITADGIVKIPNVADARHIVFAVIADVATTFTLKAQGTVQEEVPDFAATRAIENVWDYVAFRELTSADLKVGGTGVVVSNATHHKLYEIESNALTHAALELSNVSGDGVTIITFAKSDE